MNFPLRALPTSFDKRAVILINIVKQDPAVSFSSSVASLSGVSSIDTAVLSSIELTSSVESTLSFALAFEPW